MLTPSELFAQALGHLHGGSLQEAEQLYRQVLTVDPNNGDAWHLGGVVAHYAKRYDLAIERICRSLALQPENSVALLDLGNARAESGDIDGAAHCYQQAIARNPLYAEAFYNLGNCYRRMGRVAESKEYYRRALTLRPDHYEALNNLGTALYAEQKLKEAIESFRMSLAIQPNYVDALSNLGLALKDFGGFDEARTCCERAIELKPDDATAHWNNSFLALLSGDFECGWTEYEWRWKTGLMPPRDHAGALWHGESLRGKTILIYEEQGFGDTLQFIRYTPLVKGLGATVLVECKKPLVPLIERSAGIDQIITDGDDLPSFNFHVPLLNLPGIFKTKLDTIPANVPYLFAHPALVKYWRASLDEIEAGLVGRSRATKAFRIGINWAGRTSPGLHQRRDIPVAHFGVLAAISGVMLVSLQKESNPSVALPPSMVNFADELDVEHGAFMDTAAIVMNLDLVITSDTSVAHLAGALGVPVWVALPFVPDWRWLLDRSESPWYPTMRLFRQKQPGDWSTIFQDVRTALEKQVIQHSQ